MASNGVPILAQALQAHLSRKHQARMWEANQEQENEARALQQANQQQQWGRQDQYRQEDMARALEEREMRRAMEQQGMAREDQRWSADKEMQRVRMQQEKELAAARIEADKLGREYEWGKRADIARDAEKGRDTRHKTPRPASPGRSGAGPKQAAPKDPKPGILRAIAERERILSAYRAPTFQEVPNSPETARRRAEAQRLDEEINALKQEYTALTTGMTPDAPEAPPPDQTGDAPPAPPSSGKKRKL
ncbi:MAG: hypothetical protein IPL77_11175 [Flavobacteriales bacterium]|nr:hypothetical protein [Flavobacteriales bacterium]